MNSIKFLYGLIIVTSLLSLASCSEDDPTVGPGDPGVIVSPGKDISEIPTDQGSLGLTFNLRELVKKGYQPTKLDIDVQATSGDFSQADIDIDPFTYIVNHSEDAEGLTEAQRNELTEGVDVLITVRDAANEVIETKTYTKRSFAPSPEEVIIDGADLIDQNPPVVIRSDVPHYIQIFDNDRQVIEGALDNRKWNNFSSERGDFDVEYKRIDKVNYDDDRSTLYHFQPIEGKPGVYAISYHNGSNIHYLYYRTGRLFIQNRHNLERNGGNTNVDLLLDYQFEIKKLGLGTYTILPLSEEAAGGLFYSPEEFFHAKYENLERAFRILAFDIEWDIQSVETRFSDPILPSNETSSAFNSTLKNCSSGELVQTVGTAQTEKSTREVGWEESIALSSSHEFGVSLTVSAEVNTTFFGAPGKAGVSLTGSYNYTNSKTETTTNWASQTSEESVTLSTERSITVPSKRATQVTDLYQTYRNVRIPFVQRFRIRGDLEGTALTGEEIMSQFHFNGFNGIITEVGSDYIEVNVKGFTKVDKLIDTETSAEDVQTTCG